MNVQVQQESSMRRTGWWDWSVWGWSPPVSKNASDCCNQATGLARTRGYAEPHR